MRIHLRTTFAALVISTLIGNMANAQQNKLLTDSLRTAESIRRTDSLGTEVQKIKSLLNNLKIGGYVQAQYQVAQTPGIASVSSGSFTPGVDNRFMLRRGRIKIAYTGKNASQYVMEFDASEKGMAIRDMYAKFYDPWTQTVALTAGIFYRPFGDEVSLSSSKRESPEQSRIVQTLFPGERDLGIQLSLQGNKDSKWSFLKLDAGLFNGNGINQETDSKKDFISHLTLNKANKSESFKYVLGVSYYKGTVFESNENVYAVNKSGSTPVYTLKDVSATETNFGNREYYGTDLSFTVESSLGSSQLRGEYIFGDQPGTGSSSKSPEGLTSGDTYLRSFSGGYFNFVQSFKNSNLSAVAKYDWYDPNTNVEGDNLSAANGFKSGDVKYGTFGLGLLYQLDSNIRFTGYYDFVKNETSANLPGFTNDLKDNVLTLRIQYKF